MWYTCFIWRSLFSISAEKPDYLVIQISFWYTKKNCKKTAHLFPMHAFSTPWKYQKTYGFSGVREGCIGNKWVKIKNNVCKVKVWIVLNFKGNVLTYHFFRFPDCLKQTKHFSWKFSMVKKCFEVHKVALQMNWLGSVWW